MTTTTFTDGVTPVVATWLNDVDAAVYETLPGHIADTIAAHAASAIANTPAGNLVATDVQAALNELDAEKQPVDAELTALAGLTSAANKVPRFTGSGTAEVIDVAYGTYTPTGTVHTNADGVTPGVCKYIRIGDIVSVTGFSSVNPTAAGVCTVRLTLPIASNFTDTTQLYGVGNSFEGPWYMISDDTNDGAFLSATVPDGDAVGVYFHFTYQIL